MVNSNSVTSRFRQLLQQPGIIVAPGAYDCLTARIIQQAGFPAVYMTGAGTSVASLGYPDLGLATMTEMTANAASIAASVDVPVIADADTGYGGVLNVQRTVREYQRAGVAAIHIEDQEFPKRCGHLDDKRVIPVEDMVRKVRAAVDARTDDDLTIIVRTDALAVTGWDDTMRRCEAYVAAGADALFVEALRSPEEAQRVTRSFDVPLLYNFVESGKSPLIPADELERLGFKIVIFPGSAFMTVCKAVADLMQGLKEFGTTAHLMDNMVGLTECFEMMGLSQMLAQDARYAEQETLSGN
ncbi:MAG: isocitrate lyase/PEP mutase family protein [Chloroflexi bacterium]|nr:isocitrate lyase/PEP mutase family protein [Chloroflexota bacterium]